MPVCRHRAPRPSTPMRDAVSSRRLRRRDDDISLIPGHRDAVVNGGAACLRPHSISFRRRAAPKRHRWHVIGPRKQTILARQGRRRPPKAHCHEQLRAIISRRARHGRHTANAAAGHRHEARESCGRLTYSPASFSASHAPAQAAQTPTTPKSGHAYARHCGTSMRGGLGQLQLQAVGMLVAQGTAGRRQTRRLISRQLHYRATAFTTACLSARRAFHQQPPLQVRFHLPTPEPSLLR